MSEFSSCFQSELIVCKIAVPAIDVWGKNGASIAQHAYPGTSAAGSLFPDARVSVGSATTVFTIWNWVRSLTASRASSRCAPHCARCEQGLASLTLSSTPHVALTGGNTGDFSVTVQPPSATVAANATAPFTVKFAPTAAGMRWTNISIAHNGVGVLRFRVLTVS